MRRALVPLAVAVLVLATGCGSSGTPPKTWVASVCSALSPWRDQITALNTQAGTAMKSAKDPAQTRTNLVALMSGAGRASETARAKVESAGAPAIKDGQAVAARFVAALATVRDAYLKAQHAIEALPMTDPKAFYDGVSAAIETLNKDYAAAGLDTARLSSAELREDFDKVPECSA
jgi:hypothetical protein